MLIPAPPVTGHTEYKLGVIIADPDHAPLTSDHSAIGKAEHAEGKPVPAFTEHE